METTLTERQPQMSGSIFGNRCRLLVSAILVALFLTSIFCSNLRGDWFGPFGWLPFFLAGAVIWVIWLFHLWAMFIKRWTRSPKAKLPFFLAMIMASLLAIVTALQLGGVLGKAIYFHEIHMAVSAGLRENCMQLARDWPSDNDRIYSFDSVYEQLPKSIKILKPGYVLKDKAESTNSSPSIGICTDGFGGFAVGVRVFQNDDDAEKFIADVKTHMKVGHDFGYQQIAPGVYYWWQGT